MHKFDYQYGGNQNRTQETEFNGIDTLVTDFDYDQQDRLTTAIYAGDSQLQNNGIATYTYDDNSNRETETFTTAANVLSKNITYGYDNNDQLTSIVDSVESANTVVDYDTLGNLTKKSKTQNNTTAITDYIYDARNQLKQVQMGGSTIGAFLYDANGLRVHKSETLTDANTQIASTTQQRYHYQGLNVIGSFDEQNTSQYRYYHDGNQILARINESAFTDINVENNAVQTYHQDALGSTAVISNRDGSLTARYQYDAFGNVQTETGESESNDFTYTGHERDQASGLIYAKARYYDPQLGLFLSRDPFEGYDNTPLSLHRYLYAYQNPMKYVDPDGREAVPLFDFPINKETDLVQPFGTIDTGYDVLDYPLAFAASVPNAGFAMVNGFSNGVTLPLQGYAAARDLTLDQADNEITATLASTGPLAPLLLGGHKVLSSPTKLGRLSRSARAESKAVRITENKTDFSKPSVQLESDVPVIDAPNTNMVGTASTWTGKQQFDATNLSLEQVDTAMLKSIRRQSGARTNAQGQLNANANQVEDILNLTTSWRRDAHAANPHLAQLPANVKGTLLHSSVSNRVRTLDINGLDINQRIYGATQNVSPVTGKTYEYRIPDFRLNSPNVIYDIKPSGTPLSGPQFDDFRSFSGTSDVRGVFYERY
jgi:RHS repeat-associated protein